MPTIPRSPPGAGRGPNICPLSPIPLQVVAEDPTEAYTTVQFHPDGLILGTGERLGKQASL